MYKLYYKRDCAGVWLFGLDKTGKSILLTSRPIDNYDVEQFIIDNLRCIDADKYQEQHSQAKQDDPELLPATDSVRHKPSAQRHSKTSRNNRATAGGGARHRQAKAVDKSRHTLQTEQ